MEATTGFEPVSEGFADPCLTTWLRGQHASSIVDLVTFFKIRPNLGYLAIIG